MLKNPEYRTQNAQRIEHFFTTRKNEAKSSNKDKIKTLHPTPPILFVIPQTQTK